MKKIFKHILFNVFIISTATFSVVSCSDNKKNNLNQYFENVVEIKIVKNNELLGYATGTIMNDVIISNDHIIPKHISNEEVEFLYRSYKDEDFKNINLIKSSKEDDIAIFTYDGHSKGFVFSKNYQIGEKVYTIGNPLGHGLGINDGIISTFNYLNDKKIIRIAGTIEEGNSGGPIFNQNGKLIGIVSFKLKDKLIPNKTVDSFYFAITIEDILLLLNK